MRESWINRLRLPNPNPNIGRCPHIIRQTPNNDDSKDIKHRYPNMMGRALRNVTRNVRTWAQMRKSYTVAQVTAKGPQLLIKAFLTACPHACQRGSKGKKEYSFVSTKKAHLVETLLGAVELWGAGNGDKCGGPSPITYGTYGETSRLIW